MYSHNKYSIPGVLLFFLFCFSFITVKAQVIENGGLKSSVLAIQDISKKMPVEKLYLQFDKPYYSLGDVIHFKAYLINADYLTLSTHSGLLYIELDDNQNKYVKRIMIPVVSGTSWGDLALDENDIPEGIYTIRAYTNWMRNFGEDYVFKKGFYISSATERSMLVNTAFSVTNNNLQATLQFTNLNKQPVSGQMQLLVTDENKTLYKTIVSTSTDGRTDINFTIPDRTDVKHLYIIATEVSTETSGRSAVIPVTVNRPEKMDIKFMPEGGNLIAGLPARIGFKATGEDGRGADIVGTIYNSKQQPATTFRSIHKGIGSFEFTPQAGENYVAVVELPNKTTKSYPLPQVKSSGTVLRVTAKGNDSLEVTLAASPISPTTYYLIGQARGVVCYAALISFKGAMIKKTLAKDLFPTGISRFTLLNAEHQPVNERMVYINHRDDLRLSLSTNKPGYTTRDSIGLNLQVTDKTGNPVKGSFAVSVTDNGQVKPDSSGINLANYLLLTSDLKGGVEDPGYYFSTKTHENITALDDMLLTQSPVGYSWAAVFDPKTGQPAYAAETEFTVQGKVTNLFNKPVPNTNVLMLSKNPATVMAAQSDDKGEFVFKGFAPVDKAAFLIQAKNKNGKTANVGIEVNEFKSPVFTSATEPQAPWYVNTDTALLKNTLSHIANSKINTGINGNSRRLKEVTIKATRIVQQSKNLNGPGEADQVLDQDDMDRAGKLTLRQILQQKVKGFTIGQAPPSLHRNNISNRGGNMGRITYLINDKEIHFVFDGLDLDYFYFPQRVPTPTGFAGNGRPRIAPVIDEDWKMYVDGYLDYFTAEEIKGIEVMYNSQYTGSYVDKFLSPTSQISSSAGERYAYIEITTRAGLGPFTKKIPGTYIYRPLAFTLPMPFYSPKYTARNNTAPMGTDVRSTIQWAPNIITDAAGKAKVSFYSADKPGDYTLTIEGIDLNGEPGYQRQKIKVGPK